MAGRRDGALDPECHARRQERLGDRTVAGPGPGPPAGRGDAPGRDVTRMSRFVAQPDPVAIEAPAPTSNAGRRSR